LLIGHIVSQSGGILSLIFSFQKKFQKNIKYLSRQRLLFLFKHYSDFPKFRLPSQFLLVFSSQIPFIFSAKLFGAETTGQMGLALTALALPMSLLGESTGQAYYAEIAKIGRKNASEIYQLTKDITKKLFLISIPPFLVLLFGGPFLFDFVFGKPWREAGVFASVLAIDLLAQFVSSPLVNALSVFEKQFMFLKINILRSMIVIGIFIFGYLMNLSAISIIIIYSLSLATFRIYVSFSVFSVIKKSIV
jgi:O-antigen/teichoic acid export membrane protein